MLLPASHVVRGGVSPGLSRIGAATFLKRLHSVPRRLRLHTTSTSNDETTTVSRNTSLNQDVMPLLIDKPEKNIMDCIDGSLASDQSLESPAQVTSLQQLINVLREKVG